MNIATKNIVGLKELRENIDTYITRIQNGESLTVMRRSKPIFRITPVETEEDEWQTLVDFTKIQKNGVPLEDVQHAIQHILAKKA
jgi:antitoxin (DNA-binding transcriptional repressor) of toxin-antitoxin stability system